MEFIYIIIGIILGGFVVFLVLQSNWISKSKWEILQQENFQSKAEHTNLNQKISDLEFILTEEKRYSQSLLNESIEHQKNNSSLEEEKRQNQIKINELQEIVTQHLENKKSLEEEKNNLFVEKSTLEANFNNLKESLNTQKEEVVKLQELAKNEFQNLANKILEEKTEKFTEQNHQNIKTLLSPLQEKITEFEKKVENTHKESIDYHAALRQQIIGLKELNQQMSKEATNLTKALKGDNKIQGNWGELILENVLEKSGLDKGREYEVQKSHTTEDGRLQPDVIINLPYVKKFKIDSKVSLNAYERWVNEEDETQKSVYLQDHLNSLKKHIEQLSEKNYQKLYEIESPDFVLLFVPIEPAFALAINSDNQLYNKAFAKNIILVTPSTLLATLKTIDSMWTNKKQQDNSIEIARQAGALYDKFEGFVQDLIKLGKRMDDAKTDYEAAMNKLVNGKGNLIISTQKLKKMGAKANKSLPESIINRAEENLD
jgi:DNA recombination protein RmuC